MSHHWSHLLYLFTCLLVFLELAACASTVSGGIVYRDDSINQDETAVLLGGLFIVHRNGTDQQQPCGSLRSNIIQLVEAMVLAVRMINNDSTLLPNVTLTFEIRDTCTSVNYALQQSLNFIQNINEACSANNQSVLGTSGVLGPALSTISEATANFFRLFQTPQISYASTAAFLSESRFDYFFRTIPPDFYQARALADLVVHFNWTYIIALHSNDLYGRGGIEAFLELLNTNTTRRCVAITIALSNDPPNYEEAVDMMSQEWVSNASVALLFGHSDNAIGILSVIRDRISDDPDFSLQNITWIGSDSWGDSLPAEYHSMARGMLSVIPQINPIQAFDDHFTSLNPQNNSNNPWFREYWEEVFNCSLGLSPHLEDCDLDNQTISENTTGYSQFSQVSLVFDAVYAFAHSIQNLINDKCPNGDLCSEILTNGAISGELLRDYLLNVSFTSPSQNLIFFDENGDVRGAYRVLNLQRLSNSDLYTFEQVGTWDVDNSLQLSMKPLQFAEGDNTPESICSQPCTEGQISRQVPGQAECCIACEFCPENSVSIDNQCVSCSLGETPNPNRTECVMIPVTYLSWSNPWAIIILILTCIGIVATTFVIVVFLVYYKHELIKASSRELSAILLAGIFLCYILPFFYIERPSAAICAIRRFGIGFCFAVSLSALLVKTNRIHRIFNRNTSATKVKLVSPLSQVLITFAFIGVQVVIAVIWLAVEPPGTRIISSFSRNELVCSSSPLLGVAVSLGYNLLLLVLCTYFAFLTRKVPENFNEAKFINVTVYTILVTWIAFVPTYFATVNLGTVFQTTSLVFGIILSASTILCCLFMSKVFILFSRIQEKKQETKQQEESRYSFEFKN